MVERSWDVLAIPGPSGCGKSSAAAAIGRMFGVTWLQVDDLRLALQHTHVTLPERSERLYAFERTVDVWRLPVGSLVDMLIDVADVMRPAVRVVINSHLVTGVPLVIEGDGIHPELVNDPVLAPWVESGRLRFAGVCVASAEEISRNTVARGRGMWTNAEHRAQVDSALGFGQWQAARCRALGIPTETSAPLATLAERLVLATIEP